MRKYNFCLIKKFGFYDVIGRGLILAAILIISLSLTNCSKNSEPEMEYHTFTKEGELVFSDSLGKALIKIDIEIADNEYERQLGLMNRKSMEEKQGMLFIFPEERFQSFWMLNTLFSLDIMFVNSQKRIVTIHSNTTPLAQTSYPSSQPATYVVEVNAGFAERHNIKVGDKIDWIGTKQAQ